MQLDDLKTAWAAHGSVLERSLAIDERLLREVLLRKVRLGLAPYVLWRTLEFALGVGAMLLIAPVFVVHIFEPRYVVAVGAVAVYAAGLTALCAHLMVSGLRLDYDGPVTVLQRDIERIRLAEYRAFKWALLGGVALWLPAALVLFEALSGADVLARVDLAWLAANLLFGLVVLALGQALSRKYVERSVSPWARRVVDALTGRSLHAAQSRLAELARFVREEPPPAPH